METIEQTIEYILDQSQFDLGRVEAAPRGSSRSWASRPGEVVSVQEFRQLSTGGDSQDVDPDGAREARLICPKETISLLVERLRVLLKDYVDVEADTIGHAFPRVSTENANTSTVFQADGLSAISCVTPLEVFAKALVKGSALVGPGKVGSLLAGWIEGRPVEYSTCAILNGIYIGASLEPVAGISITPLPWSTDELPNDSPLLSSNAPENYLGRTIICVDTMATPPLFRPGQDGVSSPVQASSRSVANIDAVCQGLAFESDGFVDVAFQWNDYCELRKVFPTRSRSTWARSGSSLRNQLGSGWGMGENIATGVVTLSPADDSVSDLDEADLGYTVTALMEPENKGTRISAARLMKSKDSRQGLVDQFVDLRMALEALFLRDFANERSQEMRFRLSLFGAWFLGQDFEDRRRIRKVLRDAYDAASGAVHTGTIDVIPENRALLGDAQSLCRDGILKLLRDGPPADWGDLVLGSADDGPS